MSVSISQNIVYLKQKKTATELGLNNIRFVCADIHKYSLPPDYYDIVFFHSSLHHFDNIPLFLDDFVNRTLKENGLLIINEFVGATRLQFPSNQIKSINEALKLIPNKYKTRYKSKSLKKHFYGFGLLRMKIADPSECIESKSILPAIHAKFKTIIEKSYGGNILMITLKDISHHFIELTPEKEDVLNKLFAFEDNYLQDNQSDFVFGIYKKNPPIRE